MFLVKTKLIVVIMEEEMKDVMEEIPLLPMLTLWLLEDLRLKQIIPTDQEVDSEPVKSLILLPKTVNLTNLRSILPLMASKKFP